MAALMLSPQDAAALALEPNMEQAAQGVEIQQPQDLHITLAYFPMILDDQQDALIQAVASAARCFGPITTGVEGAAQFIPNADEKTPYVLLCDPTCLDSVRGYISDEACCATTVGQDHGFIPHITLAYVPPGISVDMPIPQPAQLSFSTLSLVMGDGVRHDFPLTGGGSSSMYAMRGKVEAHDDHVDPVSMAITIKGATTFGDLPLADRGRAWDGTAAEGRVRAWAGGGSNISDMDWSKYRQAFAWYDPSNPEAVGSYKLGFADIINGTLTAIPRGVFAAAAAMMGSRGGVQIPSGDRSAVQTLLGKYYAKMARMWNDDSMMPPWSQKEFDDIDAYAARLAGKEDDRADNIGEREGRRMANSWRQKISDVISSLKSVLSWAEYEEEDQKDLTSGFFTFKDALGNDRWLAVSSNSFEDREGEIITAKALEDAVAWADRTGARGTLRLWHTGPAGDIGQCDFQGIQGRFLIESGKFLDTAQSQAAKAYLTKADPQSLAMSIGFGYKEDQFDGRNYDQVRIIERSVLPHEAAANPWTLFTLKEASMDQKKETWLKDVLGDDLASRVISTADAATKELEGHVAFKANSIAPPLSDALAAVQKVLPVDSDVQEAFSDLIDEIEEALGVKSKDEKASSNEDTLLAGNLASIKKLLPSDSDIQDAFASLVKAIDGRKAKEEESKKEDGATNDAAMPGLAQTLEAALAPIAQSIASIAERVKALEGETGESAAPKGLAAYRATSASDNVLDAAKAKEVLGDDKPPTSPVAAFLEDLQKGAVA